MPTTACEAIVNYLTAVRKEHPGPDLLDSFLRYGCDLEVQVKVAQGQGEPVAGTASTFSDGIDTWFSFRIPKNANGDPYFKDYPIKFPLDLHCEAIGSTGWDWKSKRSRWVGFDFDSVVGHAEGISDEELQQVREAAIALPYVTARRSTGGKGLHLYVFFADDSSFDCPNHDVHANRAEAVLDRMSKDTGFDFRAKIDCCGGIMWLWHRNMASEGYSLIKAGDFLAVSPDTTTRSDTAWNDLLKPPPVPLTEVHNEAIRSLAQHVATEWDADRHCLRTHSFGFKMLDPNFEPHSEGRDLQKPNCFAFPTKSGFRVHWFGRHISADFSFDWAAIATQYGASPTKHGFEFETLTQAAIALRAYGKPVEVDEQLKSRPAVVKAGSGGLFAEVAKQDGDRRPKGWNGTDKKNAWTLVLRSKEDDDAECAVTPHVIAESHLKKWSYNGQPTSLHIGEDLLLWRDGCYRAATDREMMPWVTDTCRDLRTKVPRSLVSDALNALKSLSRQAQLDPPMWIGDHPDWDPRDVIPFRNGLLHVPSYLIGRDFFIPPTPTFFNRHALGFDFDPDAPSPKRWNEFLKELWDDPACHELLCEWGGYVATWDTSLQKMLMLLGTKRGGKGTISTMLHEMVGYNSCSPSFRGIIGEFGLQPVRGTQLAVFPDSKASALSATTLDQACQILKGITGEDRLTINIKNRSQVTEQLRCRVVIQSNDKFAIPDSSSALQSRQLFLNFTRSFEGKEDFELRDKLRLELPGICLQFLEGLRRLRANRGRFTLPESSRELANEVKRAAIPVSGFLYDECVLDAAACVLTTDLHAAYCRWNVDNEGEAKDLSQFGKELRDYCPGIKREQNAGGYKGYVPRKGDRPYYYIGIRFKTQGEKEHGNN